MLHDLHFILCSQNLSVLRVQRIIGLFILITQISEVGNSDHMAMYQLTFDLHAWGFVKEVVIKLCRIQQDLVTAVLDRLVPPGAL